MNFKMQILARRLKLKLRAKKAVAARKLEEQVPIQLADGEEAGDEDTSSEASENYAQDEEEVLVVPAEETGDDDGENYAEDGDEALVVPVEDHDEVLVVPVDDHDEEMQHQREVRNRIRTINTIGRKDIQQTLIRKTNRIKVLQASIELNTGGGGSCSVGQIEHWNRELISCQRKVQNLKHEMNL
ncbi:unnamed protein product [Arabidopsis lyrata]|uniref:Expressed protein n=1 Tax=Arabidopsis lyrata subsp. lyrata TaxID=81972 RepID=D7L2K3_ARALL|nr:uncharacterized protein LOC9319469 [Arabidopsis lyrata subsp. lyrata]EFH59661.1 expressed protein [Arabidopsis lyrata subsp. lyrata]CAH8261507.1 unnamed protein product [Arabidopsis lyrata]|eukprot:XP_002883402.1 uncharacterized protein LOC9319469 [Arabidopsis lyrata subsp. lyrata]